MVVWQQLLVGWLAASVLCRGAAAKATARGRPDAALERSPARVRTHLVTLLTPRRHGQTRCEGGQVLSYYTSTRMQTFMSGLQVSTGTQVCAALPPRHFLPAQHMLTVDRNLIMRQQVASCCRRLYCYRARGTDAGSVPGPAAALRKPPFLFLALQKFHASRPSDPVILTGPGRGSQKEERKRRKLLGVYVVWAIHALSLFLLGVVVCVRDVRRKKRSRRAVDKTRH